MSDEAPMKIRTVKRAKTPSGIACFSLVYNEDWFLPHFLEHHRALGVKHFIFYDDGSTDRTREILMGEEDCTILAARNPDEPRRSLGVVQLILGNFALRSYPPGTWALHLDVDEFVILPSAFSTLDELTRFLEERDLNYAMAAMVDFYPDRLSDRFFDPLGPIEGAPWFDADPVFKWVPDWPGPKIAAAGPRPRLLRNLAKQHPEKIQEIYGDDPYRVARTWKVPLIKAGSGILRANAHYVDSKMDPPKDIQLGLAHFKFYPGMDARVQNALDRKGYFQASVEYRFLKTVLDLFPDEKLTFERSIQYRSPADLERAGHIWVR
jgi:Glycosyl transferase family 2